MSALCLEVPGLPEARREVGELQEGLPIPLEVTVVCLWQGEVMGCRYRENIDSRVQTVTCKQGIGGQRRPRVGTGSPKQTTQTLKTAAETTRAPGQLLMQSQGH